MDDPPLASLSLTHVHYNPADPVSYACAWLALVPQGLCVTYATLLWSTREAEILLMFAGQMGCEALNFLLKRIIREERPKQMLGKGYGMPSSHAQFLAFFAVYLSLFLLIRHRPQLNVRSPMSKHAAQTPSLPLPSPFVQAVTLSVAVSVVAVTVAASRVYLNYHTPRQVLAGDFFGAVSAVAWFGATEVLRRSGMLAWLLDTWAAKVLRIRDLVVGEDLAESGWREWQARRSAEMMKSKKSR